MRGSKAPAPEAPPSGEPLAALLATRPVPRAAVPKAKRENEGLPRPALRAQAGLSRERQLPRTHPEGRLLARPRTIWQTIPAVAKGSSPSAAADGGARAAVHKPAVAAPKRAAEGEAALERRPLGRVRNAPEVEP